MFAAVISRRSLFTLSILVLLGGCSGGDLDRVAVTGTVTYNGEAIPVGLIRFAPQVGTDGPVSGGQIRDGKYRVDTRGGVPVGTHLVQIASYKSSDGKVYENPLGTVVPQIQLLPEKYNNESELIHEIPAESPFTLDFKLAD